jgi:glutamyl-tRNA reductase
MKSASKRLVMCGITHKTSSLEQREPVQIGAEDIARANSVLFGLPRVLESLIVSTCNRVEFYFVTDPNHDPFDTVVEFYREFADRDIAALKELSLIRKGSHAAAHLFRVAAGIDSMVLGENQILGQIKEAYSSACAVKTAGKVIHRLFHQAFRVGKQVRSDTEMGRGACSVSTAAIEMLKEHLDDEARPAILFVGVNQMVSLAASRLSRMHHSGLYFANRTKQKAVELARKFNARGYGLDRLSELIEKSDVLVSCTSAKEPIVQRDVIDSAVQNRPGRPLIVIDLAMPRDIDYPHDSNPAVAVHDLEDIKAFVDSQQAKREEAVPQAEEIISQKLAEFKYWWQHVKQEPLYNGEGTAIEEIVQEELAELLPKCPVSFKNELSHITRRIVQRVVQVSRPSPAERQEK